MTRSFAPARVDVEGAARRWFERFDRVSGGRRVAVWGAGRAGGLAVSLLRRFGRAPHLVIDRDPLRCGGDLDGVPIAGVAAIAGPSAAAETVVLLASMHHREMAAWLEHRGWRGGRDFLPSPVGSVYAPEAGFVLDALSAAPGDRRGAGRRRRADAAVGGATVFASSAGNFYFRELQAFLVAGLRRIGWQVAAADENAAGSAGVPIVVGPHEFFTIGRGVRWLTAENLRAAVLVTTEQPQGFWADAFGPALERAGAVVDISPEGARALGAGGRPADWLPLGWFPGCVPFDLLPADLPWPASLAVPAGPLPPVESDPWDSRPIDVLFVGSHSPRRARWLGRLREALPDARWHVELPGDGRPMTGGPAMSALAVGLARRAKIVLNLHRDDTTYAEWQRLVWRGLWQRALVVTEPIGPIPGLAAGTDFLERPVAAMAEAIRQALSPAGRVHADAVRRAGWCSGTAIPFTATAAVLATAVGAVGADVSPGAVTA